jgi:hypothetical protein
MPDQPHDAGDTSDDLSGPLMLTPRCPDQVPRGREMSTLLDDFHHVHWQLQQRRRGLAGPLLNEHLISVGLAELALGAALIERLRSIRWHTVSDVLAAGGSPTECAAALGLHPPGNLSDQLRAWANSQREEGLMSDDQHRQIIRLAADATNPLRSTQD